MKSKVTVLFIACTLLVGTCLVLANGPAAEEATPKASSTEVVTMNGKLRLSIVPVPTTMVRSPLRFTSTGSA